MTQNSKYSSDVETLTINGDNNSWDRPRTSDEIKNFLQRRFSIVGELDATDYEVSAL